MAEYKAHYDKIKELFLKQINSEAYSKSCDASDAFFRKCRIAENKMNPFLIVNQPITIETMMAWLKKNIHKTDFRDFTEAQTEFDDWSELQMKATVENMALYDYMEELMKVHPDIFPDIFTEVINDVTLNHPGKFRY